MVTIEEKMLKDNIDEYVELAKKERIDVTSDGNYIFSILPKSEILQKEWESLFGTLPKEAYDDEVSRE